MAGLDPAIYSSHESVVKVVPLGILDEDKIDFPGARPMLHIPLTLDRRANVVVALSPNQTFKAVLLGETIRYTFSMLPSTASEIAGNPDIKGPVWSVSHDVDPSALRGPILRMPEQRRDRSSDGRVKPGHDANTSHHFRRTS